MALRIKGEDQFLVPVTINSVLTLEFILDTGASDVSIHAEVALTLVHSGTITETDFIGTRRYRLANGATIDGDTIRLRSVGVGDRLVENVTASVSSPGSDLLLGQSFLRRFKSWSLSNERRQLILD